MYTCTCVLSFPLNVRKLSLKLTVSFICQQNSWWHHIILVQTIMADQMSIMFFFQPEKFGRRGEVSGTLMTAVLTVWTNGSCTAILTGKKYVSKTLKKALSTLMPGTTCVQTTKALVHAPSMLLKSHSHLSKYMWCHKKYNPDQPNSRKNRENILGRILSLRLKALLAQSRTSSLYTGLRTLLPVNGDVSVTGSVKCRASDCIVTSEPRIVYGTFSHVHI